MKVKQSRKLIVMARCCYRLTIITLGNLCLIFQSCVYYLHLKLRLTKTILNLFAVVILHFIAFFISNFIKKKYMIV